MNYSLRNIIPFMVLCIFLPYITADDDDMRLVAIRTLLITPNSTSAAVISAIDTGMDLISDDDDRRRGRNLRPSENERGLTCSTCRYYPSYYTGCWIRAKWVRRCRRNLVVHRKLSEDAIEKLDDNKRRRYLTLAQDCQDGIDDRDDEIATSTVAGIVPVLPVGASFVEECIFEPIDDDEEGDDDEEDEDD